MIQISLLRVAILTLIMLAFGLLLIDRYDLKSDLASEKLSHSQLLTRLADERADAEIAARVEEGRRTNAIMEITNEATAKTNRAIADAQSAHAANSRLRQQLAKYTAKHQGEGAIHPNAANAGTTAESPLTVLANLFSSSDDRAGALAKEADRARVAGQACESAYDALSAPVGQNAGDVP